MASCYGRRRLTVGDTLCAGPLYRCTKCGHVGCEKPKVGDCTNQTFAVGRCLRCGANGTRQAFH